MTLHAFEPGCSRICSLDGDTPAVAPHQNAENAAPSELSIRKRVPPLLDVRVVPEGDEGLSGVRVSRRRAARKAW